MKKNDEHSEIAGISVQEEKPNSTIKKRNVVDDVKQVEHDIEDAVLDTIHHTKVSFKPKSRAGRKLRILFKRKFPFIFQHYYKLVLVMLLVLAISSYSYIRINELMHDKKLLEQTNKALSFDLNNSKTENEKTKLELNKMIERLAGSSFIIVNKQTFLDDMAERFPNISPKIAKVIVDTVIDSAKKYNINPIILYSLGIVESSHRFWIEHKKTLVTVQKENGKDTKKIYVQAVGWGGIVWEHHYKLLKDKGIAQTRADLFYPDVNIKAAAAVYNMMFNLPMKKGTSNQDESAQRRYFGGNYKSYSDKINEQVVALVNAEICRKNNVKKEM